MTATTVNETGLPRINADRLLGQSTAIWFGVAMLGQWLFAYYMFGFYGVSALGGDIQAWNTRLFRGIIQGDLIGNLAVGSHLFVAFILAFCGPLQFIPQIRNRFRAFHRINGRVYLVTAVATSVAGLYLILARGGVGLIGDISLGLNGLFILFCAYFAYRFARARKIDRHRRWALRLFLVVNGFLFARAGFQAWIFLTGGWGHSDWYDGPFDMLWGFGSYMLPLAILEAYFAAQRASGPHGKVAMAALMLLLAALTGLGIFLLFKNSWLPFLS